MNYRRSKIDERQMCWDEENRLSAVHDRGALNYISSYIYDAGGERVWKFDGPVMLMQLNAKTVHYTVNFNKTLYVNPYMVMTDGDYTKHYYIEGERICSKIGGGFGSAPRNPRYSTLDFIESNENGVANKLKKLIRRNIVCAGYTGKFRIYDKLLSAHDMGNENELLMYFYHTDHLGSSSFISRTDGRANQHIQYLPYGELFVSQQNSQFDSRYKFTAKEHDTETNYTYFGARYYDSDASIWLSVDLMAGEYPSTSPYTYTLNNPLRFIDRDGLSAIDVSGIPPFGNQTLHFGYENTMGLGPFSRGNTMLPIGDRSKGYFGNYSKLFICNSNYYSGDNTVSVRGGGAFVGGYTISIDKSSLTGFWENGIYSKKNISYPLELGASIGRGHLILEKDILVKLNTNSLVDVMNYGSEVESRAGGLVWGGGYYKGYNKNGDLVWTIEYQGFFSGYSDSFGKSSFNEWHAYPMSKEDSINEAKKGYKQQRGNISTWVDYLKTNDEFNE